MGFWNDVTNLRKENKISKQWSRKDLRRWLSGTYRPNHINVRPSNDSLSQNGDELGNTVKAGGKPWAWRMGKGIFQLIQDPQDPPQVQQSEKARANSLINRSPTGNKASSSTSQPPGGVNQGLIRSNIASKVRQYMSQAAADLDHRYRSFNYCYNYFYRNKGYLTKDLEKSCLVLGFYLASWGMFRGASFLLQKSARHYQRTIEYIDSLYNKAPYLWQIDVDQYSSNIDSIMCIYEQIKKKLSVPNTKQHSTLATKVMLGIFGFVPAYDRYFRGAFHDIFVPTCGFTKFNEQSLGCIKEFYEANRDVIDRLSSSIHTIDFPTGGKTEIKYPKAKIIDMYGFMTG